MTTPNQRRYARVREEEEIYLTVQPLGEDDQTPEVHCYSEDISEFGLRVRLGTSFEVEQKLRVKVVTKNPEATYMLLGTVRWINEPPFSSPYYMGVEILRDSSPDDLKRWRAFVVNKLP